MACNSYAAAFSQSLPARRFCDRQRRRDSDVDSQHTQQQQCAMRSAYVPSGIRCPTILHPYESFLGDVVPFAEALRSDRSRRLPVQACVEAFDDPGDFEWLELGQANNSSGESSSRKVAAKESAKREIDNYFFMYFRVRMENYIALVTAVKQSCKDESIFNEENLDRWTHKFKFKIRRSAPLKKALMAFSSRMGLEGDPDVMYCADGFYGDAFTGRTYSRNEVPNNRILPANTSLATGLRNASNVFVSRINSTERTNAITQLQLDLLKGNDPEDEVDAEAPDGWTTATALAAAATGAPKSSSAEANHESKE